MRAGVDQLPATSPAASMAKVGHLRQAAEIVPRAIGIDAEVLTQVRHFSPASTQPLSLMT